MSKINYIYYGDGDIRIKYSGEISAFDIMLSGVYELESYNPTNFLINYHKNRVVGVGLGSTLGESAFLKYTGDLQIRICKIITTDMQMIILVPKLVRKDKFNSIRNAFNGEQANFEDLDKVGVVGRIPSRTTVSIITKNLNASIGQYTLDGADYIGDYHLHHTGVAMTGADHTEDSEILTLKSKSKKTKEIRGVVRNIATSSSTGGY